MADLEETIVDHTIARIVAELPFYKNTKRLQNTDLGRQNEEALVDTSSFKTDIVANKLLEELTKLSVIQSSTEEDAQRVASSQLQLLRLLEQCLAYPWKKLKENYNSVKEDQLSKEEQIRLKEQVEKVLPPPIDQNLCARLYKALEIFLTAKSTGEYVKALQVAACRCLYQISASNYDDVATRILPYLTPSSSEEDVLTYGSQLEHLNLNEGNLSHLLTSLMPIISGTKKTNVQVAYAKVVRQIIWNWINQYPLEFVNLCKEKRKLNSKAEELFDTFDGWASNSAKKASFWPTCMMLMVLCPDVMVQVVLQKQSSGNNSNKKKFFDSLSKGLGTSKLADVATVCFVDVCKASTYNAKSAESALVFLFTQTEPDLTAKLFNSAQAAKSEASFDEQLMTEFLLSSFFLSPRKIINSLFAECVKNNSPPLFKRVLVNTLYRIANETPLPWNPTIADVYAAHAGNLRIMFKNLLPRIEEFESLKNSTDKKGRQILEKVLADIEILKNLIALFHADPVLALFPQKDSTNHLDDIRNLITGLCSCVAEFDIPQLSSLGRDALLALHRPENIKNWHPEDPSEGFWVISSAMSNHLGNSIRDRSNLSPESVEDVINLLEQIYLFRVQHIEQTPHIEPSASTRSVRLLASSSMESALLVFLGSRNNELVSKCLIIFKYLCREVELLRHCLTENDNTLICNFDAYKMLADASGNYTGRQAQQKTIQKALKKVQVHSVGNFVAWDEVYKRWKETTEQVAANEETATMVVANRGDGRKAKKPIEYDAKAAAEIQTEWTNCLGILCSLSAVLLSSTSATAGTNKQNKFISMSDPNEFVERLMSYLTSEYVGIREKAKLMMGNALSPEIFPLFFRILHTYSKDKLFKTSDQATFNNETILYVDQAISTVKLILDGEHEEGDLSSIAGIDDIIMILIKFVRQTTINANTAQIRHKLCALVESVMTHKNTLSFNDENQFRTDLIENIMEWTSEFSTKDANLPTDLGDSEKRQLKKLIMELDSQVLSAISSLLEGLTLSGKDDEAKSNLFSKFFTFFTRLLTRCKKAPQTVITPALPEATIQSLSYLVTANIEHGLEYFVTMGYHRDHETRSSFLKVLTNILKERSDFDSGEVGDKYYKLIELIMEPDLEVVLALGNTTTEEDLTCQLLVCFFEANEKTLDLLKAAIVAEVRKTEAANTLFRLNSIATKLLTQYCRLVGRDYLRIALGPKVKQLMQNPPPFEVDPAKMPAGEDLATNQANINRLCQEFLEDIEASIAYCPAGFRQICAFLSTTVTAKFPDAGHTAVAGFMFLRYLCPALTAPFGFGVVDTNVNPAYKRCFILVAKVIQNLANRVQFTKEPFMHFMNPFIEEKLPVIRAMLDRYCVCSENDPQPPPISFSEEQKATDIGRIHYYLNYFLPKITKELAGSPETVERLTSILNQLGEPPALPKSTKTVQMRQATISGSNQKQYEKFMKRMANKNTDEIKKREIYYQHGQTVKKEPVFYYIARRYTGGNDDLLFYHMLETTRNYLTKPYALVVDLSLFTPQTHQLPNSALATISKIIPSVASSNLSAVYFVNTNIWFKKYSKNIAKHVPRVNRKFVFCSDIAQLHTFIAKDECKLPSDTYSMVTTVQSTFSPVTKITQNNKKDVKLVICAEALNVITLKPQPVLGGQAIITDIVHVSTLVDIHKAPTSNMLSIRYQMGDGQRSIELISESKDQIAQQLIAFRDRYKLSMPHAALARSKAFRPSDVPGTLLNMALMNLTVSNHALRAAAYNLLVALCHTFAFKIESILLEANDAAVPKSTKQFTVRVSSELAQMEPGMTLEFLQQSLDGMSNADKVSQVLILDYIKPWLRNYGSYFFGETTDAEKTDAKMVEIFEKLVTFSIKADVIRPAINTKVWTILGRCTRVLELAVEQLLAAYTLPAHNDDSVGCLDDIIASVASSNAELVSAIIIRRMLARLDETAEGGEIERIEKRPVWKEIEVMLKWLLILSFDDLLCVELHLPQLLHIILMTFFSGDALIRSTVYALFLNTVHALFSSQVCSEEKLIVLRLKFHEFQELPTRLQFGVGGQTNYEPFQAPSKRDGKMDNVTLAHTENVANFIYQILNCCTDDANCIGTERHSHTLSLLTKTAFSANPLLQPRAIVGLGVLAQSSTLITEELIHNLIELLRDSLANCSTKNKIDDLTVSIISCLSRNFTHISPDSKYYQSFFWIAMSLSQIQDKKLFLACISFLDQIVRAMSDQGCYRGKGLAACCMQNRKGPYEGMLNKLDQLSGISFKYDFSFAVAGHLLKGLKTVLTKSASTRLLNTFVEYSGESNPANVTGYFGAILPHCGDNLSEACRQRLLACSESGNSLFNEKMVPDKTRGALLFAYLSTILKSSESEHEQLYIYRALNEGAQFMPDCFPVTFDVLMPKVDQVITTSQNEEMLTIAMAIMNSVYAHGLESTSPVNNLNKAYLESIGFAALPNSDQFHQNQKGALIQVVCSILDGILQL